MGRGVADFKLTDRDIRLIQNELRQGRDIHLRSTAHGVRIFSEQVKALDRNIDNNNKSNGVIKA